MVATFRADQEAGEARQSATELEQKNRELAEESQTDKLTRLHNRGHAVGDIVLVTVAGLLGSSMVASRL